MFLVARATARDRGVIVRNRIFAERLVAGTDPYEGGLHTPYPLTWALIHAALLPLPLEVARALWCSGQILLLVLVTLALDRIAARHVRDYPRRRGWILAAALVLTSRFWLRDMAGGGSNLLIFSLAFFGCLGAIHGRPVLGAASLGLAGALKLTPLLFLPYFVLRRRPGFALRSAAFAGLFLVLPAVVLGPETYAQITERWARGVLGFLAKDDLGGPDAAIIPFEWMNQSLRNALFRFLTPIELDHPWYVNVGRLSPEVATWIIRAVSFLLLAFSTVLLSRREPRGRFTDIARVGFVFVLMLLLSPISWRAHFVSLLPAVFVLSVHALCGERRRILSQVTLVAFLLLGPGTNETFWGKEGKNVLQAYYTVTVGTLALLLPLAIVIRRPRLVTGEPGPPGPSPPSAPARSSRAPRP